jgi:hypothetical protein
MQPWPIQMIATVRVLAGVAGALTIFCLVAVALLFSQTLRYYHWGASADPMAESKLVQSTGEASSSPADVQSNQRIKAMNRRARKMLPEIALIAVLLWVVALLA